MRYTCLALATLTALITSVAAHAQEHGQMDHRQHMAAPANDQRQAVSFPPAMREHTLSSMRDHLQALSEILAAMSGAQYAKAADIAKTRLGMDSPSAAGCKSENAATAPQISRPVDMAQQMAQMMPDGMRNIGLEMHQSASAFAAVAAKTGKRDNAKPALAALARITEQCASCHSAYKLQ